MSHVLRDGPSQLDVLEGKELSALLASVKQRLSHDLDGVPELLQSARLLEPMPVLRSVSVRLDAPDKGADRALLLDIVPRRGASVEGVEVAIFEKRPTGLRLLSRLRPTDLFYRLPLDEDVCEIQYTVTHDELGLLLQSGPHGFIRSVSINLDLIAGERRVQVPSRKGRPAATRRIPVSSGEQAFVVGQQVIPLSAVHVFHAIQYRVESRETVRDRHFFLDDVAKAEGVVQNILKGARHRALVVDPYFSWKEIAPWLPSVAHRGAEVRVLTSRAGLRQIAIEDPDVKGDARELLHLERFRKCLDESARDQNINPTSVRLMQGERPAIHDRFIVADNRAWLLGSSLNEFGSRGTMLVPLPTCEDIVRELDEVWRASVDLNILTAKLEKGER
jgi:hypothetical protein